MDIKPQFISTSYNKETWPLHVDGVLNRFHFLEGLFYKPALFTTCNLESTHSANRHGASEREEQRAASPKHSANCFWKRSSLGLCWLMHLHNKYSKFIPQSTTLEATPNATRSSLCGGISLALGTPWEFTSCDFIIWTSRGWINVRCVHRHGR